MATEIKSARDALEKIEKLAHCDLCNVYPKHRAKFDAKIGGIERIAKAALALPRLNCEVGTLTEQQQRFHDFCEKMQHTDKACCGGCPIVHLRVKGVIGNSCELAWAQMPYEAEEGVHDGSK